MSDPKKSARRPHWARRVLTTTVPIVLLLAAATAAFLYWQWHDRHATAAAAPPPGGPTPVAVHVVTRETVPIQKRYLGETEGSLIVEIRARVAGYLQERTFKEGERVEKGQLLYQIDPRPFDVQLEISRARLRSSQATLARARQQLARYEALQATASVTRSEIEEWQKEEGVALADVELQKAEIASAELQKSYTRIESPITGIIGKSLKDIGSYVDAGTNGLVAVVQQLDPIYVRFTVTEQEQLKWQAQLDTKQVTAAKPQDQELEIILADGTTYPHTGKVNYIDVQVDRNTGTSIVRGTMPNPKGLLKPGQFIYVHPLNIQRVDVIRIPQKAVLQSPAGASVFVINSKNQAEPRTITLGDWLGDDRWIVSEGLQPGDRVITDHLMTMHPGADVTIAPAAPATLPAQAQAKAGDAQPTATEGKQ